ncbi:MAG: HDOD domain-containing protein [Phycisphaerales bacterium]
MSSSLLDRVLACPGLPTLPGVAMRVLELTRDPQVSIVKIAQTVQNDPALSTKVLKTVNSSYYGLTTPCPSISRAMSLLGLNTVKSIVLGFSVVDSAKGIGGAFDITSYWRRAVFSAAGARAVAIHTKCYDPEEAFLGALLQDIGVLASWVALKDQYLDVLNKCGEDHDETLIPEQTALEFDHTQAGAKLAAKWRLPPQLVECISQHHTPDRCHPQFDNLLKCVHLGGLAAAALTLPDPKKRLGAFIIRAREWFKIESSASRDLLPLISKGAGEVAKLLEVRTGATPNVTEILSEAHELLIATQDEMRAQAAELQRQNDELARQTVTDGLTGVNNRKFFDRELASIFECCGMECSALSLLFIDGDRFKSVNDTHGHKAGDAVLIDLAKRMQQAVGTKGHVCRYGGEEFAVILPRCEGPAAAEIAESVRAAVESRPVDITNTGAKVDQISVTVSIGLSVTQPGRDSSTAESIVQQADASVYQVKRTGRNRVVEWGSFSADDAPVNPAPPAPAPAAPPETRVLLIDDDPLAIRLLQVLLSKKGGMNIATASSGEEGVKALSNPINQPDIVVVDGRMPGMSGLQFIKWMKSNKATAHIPAVMLTGISHDAVRAGSLAAGASLFVEKTEFCAKPDEWIAKMMQVVAAARAA